MKAAAIFIGVLAGAAGAYMAAVFLAAGSAAKTVVMASTGHAST